VTADSRLNHILKNKRTMSLKMTVQMEHSWRANYSRYHPDNLNKLPPTLPEPVKGPPPLAGFSQIEKDVYGAWGHSLCCESANGKNETTVRIKQDVTPKVGQDWRKVAAFEKAKSISMSAMYGGSLREMSFEEIVEARGKKG